MTKRIYKAVKVNEVFASELIETAGGRRVAIGVDVAKETCYAQPMVPSEEGPVRLMRAASRGRLAWDKVEAVLHCAQNTRGVPAIDAEREWVKQLAQEAKQAREQAKQARSELAALTTSNEAVQLKITKRGPAKARRYLYMAAMRLLQSDAAVGAWYQRKVARDGGRHRRRAVVAVMRKLVMALFHVARGEIFDSSRLFDTKRLQRRLRAA